MATRSEPSLSKVAFNCAHCGALAHQTWYDLYAASKQKDHTPNPYNEDFVTMVLHDQALSPANKDEFVRKARRSMAGEMFFDGRNDKVYNPFNIENLWISECYSCNKLSLWISDSIVYPKTCHGDEPNEDLPDDIRRDFEEARSVLQISPRSAAALLRLAIQKLCKALGGTGSDLNKDIAALVQKGLDPRVQQALDIVRVIGNEAVHPGQIDLRDDREIPTQLLRLVNLIAEKMITEPKHVKALFESLPSGKRDQIAKRDIPQGGSGNLP